jgi:hypothetical protein
MRKIEDKKSSGKKFIVSILYGALFGFLFVLILFAVFSAVIASGKISDGLMPYLTALSALIGGVLGSVRRRPSAPESAYRCRRERWCADVHRDVYRRAAGRPCGRRTDGGPARIVSFRGRCREFSKSEAQAPQTHLISAKLFGAFRRAAFF